MASFWPKKPIFSGVLFTNKVTGLVVILFCKHLIQKVLPPHCSGAPSLKNGVFQGEGVGGSAFFPFRSACKGPSKNKCAPMVGNSMQLLVARLRARLGFVVSHIQQVGGSGAFVHGALATDSVAPTGLGFFGLAFPRISSGAIFMRSLPGATPVGGSWSPTLVSCF